MDPVTQGALGAAWAQPGADRARIVAATAVGCAAGMAPDLDVLIRSNADPLLALELHRHFTHSLFFVPLGALLCAFLVYPFARSSLNLATCYGFSLLGYASHGLLDACTSYGTLLLWPFSMERVAWDLVSVIDPLFTLPLITFVAAGIVRRRRRFAIFGCLWCVAYLLLGFAQNLRAERAVAELAAARGHVPERVAAKPSLANIFLWRTLYFHDGRIYVDAVRVGRRTLLFEGGSRDALDIDRDYPLLTEGSQQHRDIERFRWFADGYLAVDPDAPNRIVDLRYSLVPNSLDAFWGIEIEPAAPNTAHAGYVTMRARSLAEGRELLDMLFR